MVDLARYSALAALNERLRDELPQWLSDQKKIVESARRRLEDSRRQTQELEFAFRKVKHELGSLEKEYTEALEQEFKDHGLDPSDVGYFLDELANNFVDPELVTEANINHLKVQRALLSE